MPAAAFRSYVHRAFMASSPPFLCRLELQPAHHSPNAAHASGSPATDSTLWGSRLASDPRALASALRPAETGVASASSAQRRLKQRTYSVGDMPRKAGSLRRFGSRSTSVSDLTLGSSPTGSADSQRDQSPGSARARQNRRRMRTRSDTELDNSNSPSARIVTLWRSERTTEDFCCGAPGLVGSRSQPHLSTSIACALPRLM